MKRILLAALLIVCLSCLVSAQIERPPADQNVPATQQTPPTPPNSTPPTFPPDKEAPPPRDSMDNPPVSQRPDAPISPDDEEHKQVHKDQIPSSTTPALGSSTEVQSQIEAALKDDPSLAGITVTVSEDEVQLSGMVDNGKDQRNARSIAQSYAGGRKLVDRLKIANPKKG